MACQKSHHLPCDYSLFLPALILTTAVLSCLPGAPSAPGCLAASGRQARLRQAVAGAPASLRRTRWRGFGLSLRSDPVAYTPLTLPTLPHI
ncbi:hypothetical protein [Escherichia coli]|uniref:hypothetical protein n=1 Tax=Escherichia coli TaxID=562 RepID=UPI00098A0188|nr:hypothetical protein [Escherichia coli]